jgi:DNA invertase Pin-like site-specific DNA recombinase
MRNRERPRGERGAGYLRVSDGGKQEIESQRQQLLAWAERMGVKITAWYIDSDGRNSRHKGEQRVEFQRMLADVAAERWDWIVVDAQDRFGVKNNNEFNHFLRPFLKAGCELWTPTQGELTDQDNPVSVLLGGLGTLTSRREQQDKGHRIMRGLLKAAKEGLYTGGRLPFGFDVAIYKKGDYTREKWRVVFDGNNRRVKVWPDGRTERFDGKGNFPAYESTEEARLVLSCDQSILDAVRWAFTCYATEDVSCWVLARRLHERGFRPPSGQSWTDPIVRHMLDNPVYKGLRVFGREHYGDFADYRLTNSGPEAILTSWEKDEPVHQGKRPREEWIDPTTFRLPAIVDDPTWEAVQRKLESVKLGRSRPPRSDNCWLRPFICCGHCGAIMRARSRAADGRGQEYVCAVYEAARLKGTPNPQGCRRHCLDHDFAERIVNHYLAEKCAVRAASARD